MPKIKTENKKQITVRIAADTAARLEAFELSSNVPKSIHVQLALNDYLAKHSQCPTPRPASGEG